MKKGKIEIQKRKKLSLRTWLQILLMNKMNTIMKKKQIWKKNKLMEKSNLEAKLTFSIEEIKKSIKRI